MNYSFVSNKCSSAKLSHNNWINCPRGSGEGLGERMARMLPTTGRIWAALVWESVVMDSFQGNFSIYTIHSGDITTRYFSRKFPQKGSFSSPPP